MVAIGDYEDKLLAIGYWLLALKRNFYLRLTSRWLEAFRKLLCETLGNMKFGNWQ